MTAFRYALVESDEMNLEEQHAMIRELELPVAALVSSGGKSLHAIVRIEAGSFENTAPAWTTSMRCVRRTA